jgi:hypothetical protein
MRTAIGPRVINYRSGVVPAIEHNPAGCPAVILTQDMGQFFAGAKWRFSGIFLQNQWIVLPIRQAKWSKIVQCTMTD